MSEISIIIMGIIFAFAAVGVVFLSNNNKESKRPSPPKKPLQNKTGNQIMFGVDGMIIDLDNFTTRELFDLVYKVRLEISRRESLIGKDTRP